VSDPTMLVRTGPPHLLIRPCMPLAVICCCFCSLTRSAYISTNYRYTSHAAI